jgi:transposase-like protein
MEATPPAVDLGQQETHVLAPENLPPPDHVPRAAPPDARDFGPKERLALVIELIESGESTSVVAARHGLLPRALRSWSNTHNVRALEIINKKRKELKESIKQTVKESQQMESKKDVPYQRRNSPVSEEVKEKALKLVLAGGNVKGVAKEFGMSPHTVRKYYEEKTGKKLRIWEIIKKVAKSNAAEIGAAPIGGGRLIKTKTGERRLFSAKEQILYAVRYKKLKINNYNEGAKVLGVGPNALRDWVMKFDQMKPQKRGAAARYAETGEGPPPSSREAMQIKVLERIEAGERATDLAQEIGVHPSSLRNWWDKYRQGKEWPAQKRYMGQELSQPKQLRGPQKKTLKRMAIRDALISNGEVIAAQDLGAENITQANGHPIPISTGKAMRDVIIFLQLARDEFDRDIRAGHMRCDNPAMLHAMLALHSATK